MLKTAVGIILVYGTACAGLHWAVKCLCIPLIGTLLSAMGVRGI